MRTRVLRTPLAPLLRSRRVLGGLVASVPLILALACGRDEPEEARTGPEPSPRAEIFVDRAAESGLGFAHFNGMSGEQYIVELTGAGAGMVDYDGDGDLDLYLVQGTMLGPGKSVENALTPPPEPGIPTDRLYRNDLEIRPGGTRRLRFVDVTDRSGIQPGGYGMGIATGDYDNDGWIDLYVTNLGSNRLYRNNGDGTFTDTTAVAAVEDERWSVPAAFLDYDRDGWLDLFVGNYVDFTFENHRTCRSVAGMVDYCGPNAYRPVPDRLFHNEGDGTFRDVTRLSGLPMSYGPALGVVVADFNEDRWLDIYVANDGNPNQMWVNRGDGSFVDEAMLSGTAVNAEGYSEASMGVEAADFDGDGDEDLFMTHLTGETNTIYQNEGGGLFVDVSSASGLGTPSKWATSFGTAAIDYDNDGWLDALVVSGAVRVIEEQVRQGVLFPLGQPNQLFHNLGRGRFEEVTDRAGSVFERSEVSRGAAFGDVDNDGDTDVLVLNNNGPARMLMNQVGQDRNWLGLRLLRSDGDAPALGVRAALLREHSPDLWRRVRADGSFASANDTRILFGLASSGQSGRVEAHSLHGHRRRWLDAPVGHYATVREVDFAE